MLSSYRNMLFLAALLLSSFSSLILASPTYGSNSTALYTPSVSALAPSPTSTYAGSSSNTTTIFITSPTGISNGTSGSNSTASGRPLSPSTTPVPASAASSLREFGYGSACLAVVIGFAVASL
ncbi:hypothetical protein BKA65DRAFT_509509 [Rhexocercosporidium sp. MPI-PUGE-AT-0058]|nr:hypothetical protein BKA65DRAFT_509509 [Rhexocercosporidium sp. MPI-PUGE-AT-0058]